MIRVVKTGIHCNPFQLLFPLLLPHLYPHCLLSLPIWLLGFSAASVSGTQNDFHCITQPGSVQSYINLTFLPLLQDFLPSTISHFIQGFIEVLPQPSSRSPSWIIKFWKKMGCWNGWACILSSQMCDRIVSSSLPFRESTSPESSRADQSNIIFIFSFSRNQFLVFWKFLILVDLEIFNFLESTFFKS